MTKVKVTISGRAAFCYSAIQSPFAVSFPRSLGYIRKLVFRVYHWKQFHSYFLLWQSTYGTQEFKLAQTLPSQGTSSRLAGVEPHSFLVPRKFTLGQCRIQTRNLLISSEISLNIFLLDWLWTISCTLGISKQLLSLLPFTSQFWWHEDMDITWTHEANTLTTQ